MIRCAVPLTAVVLLAFASCGEGEFAHHHVDAVVSARCSIPEHGHGMNVVPQGRELGLGLYQVEGMLLHMRGRWVLGIDLILDGLA